MDEYAEAAGMDEYAEALADGIDAALPGWVARSVARLVTAWSGRLPVEVAAAAGAAGEQARRDLLPRVRALLGTDIDEQTTTPLALLREAVRYPTEVLQAAGVAPVRRDSFAERAFPADIYDLSPASFADIDPALAEPGLRWGAAKAFEHKRRHRS